MFEKLIIHFVRGAYGLLWESEPDLMLTITYDNEEVQDLPSWFVMKPQMLHPSKDMDRFKELDNFLKKEYKIDPTTQLILGRSFRPGIISASFNKIGCTDCVKIFDLWPTDLSNISELYHQFLEYQNDIQNERYYEYCCNSVD